jgi:diguanylate cyclase (GGDEF)-like protein
MDIMSKIKMLLPNHMALQKSLTISLLIMVVTIVMLATVAIFSLEKVIELFDEVVEESTEEMHPVNNLQIMLLNSWMPAHDYLIHGNISERNTFAELSREIDQSFDLLLESPFKLTEEKEKIQMAKKEWQVVKDMNQKILAIPDPVGNEAAAMMMERLDVQMNLIIHLLNETHEMAMHEMNEHLEHSQQVKQNVYLLIGGIFIAWLLIAIGAGFILSRSILGPVKSLERVTKRFGEGDLSARVEGTYNDEIGHMASTFNEMADKLQKNQETLKEMASRDSLTELYNHGEFHRRVREEVNRSLRYGHVFSIMILDVDYFKDINDEYGHQTGDNILQIIAYLLVKAVRPVDHVARYGGDEFAIIMPETPCANAINLAERIRNTIASHTFPLSPPETTNLTVSVGIADYPNSGKNESELIGVADQAMYTAKRTGRNRVCSFE